MGPESPLEISQILNTSGTVATVHCAEDLALLETLPAGEYADLLEFRLDSLSGTPEPLAAGLASAPLPAIITARHPEEGGDGHLTSEERQNLFENALPLASAIDLELRSLAEGGAGLASRAREAGKLLILSAHHFEDTPPLEVLEDLIAGAAAGGADIAKIATRINAPGDLATLIALAGKTHPLPLSLMGMGPLGRVSRLALAQCGSILNYGYLAKANAPGQWPARRLKELLTELAS